MHKSRLCTVNVYVTHLYCNKSTCAQIPIVLIPDCIPIRRTLIYGNICLWNPRHCGGILDDIVDSPVFLYRESWNRPGNSELHGESRTLPGESRTLPGESRTLTGESRTLTGESRTLTGESRMKTRNPGHVRGIECNACVHLSWESPQGSGGIQCYS